MQLEASLLGALFERAGAIPVRFTGDVVPVDGALDLHLTLVSSLFLHGGWAHVLGNMWFLWIFGDNIEDRLGPFFFLLFYLFAGVAATATHIATVPDSTAPVIGASGCISGVLGAYAVLLPRARVYSYIWIVIFIRTFYLPAALYLGFWFLWQFLSLGQEGVAWWAHIGGFIAGLGFGLLLRLEPRLMR